MLLNPNSGTESHHHPQNRLTMDTPSMSGTPVITSSSGSLIQHTSTVMTHPAPHHPFQNTDIYIRHPVEVETIVSLEQCSVCSTFFEAPSRQIPLPDLNRMICKALDLLPDMSFYKQYIPVCVNCANLLRKFDRLRVEMEFVKTQLVTHVVETLTQIRAEGGSPLDGLKSQILNRWVSGSRDSRKKGKGNEGYSAAAQDGDLSWAACNNVMKSNTGCQPVKTWNVEAAPEGVVTLESSPTLPEYPSDNDNGSQEGDDFIHANASDNDADFAPIEDTTESVKNTNSRENSQTQITGVAASNIKPKRKKKVKKKKRISEGVAPLICVNCGRVFTQRVPFKGHTQVCTSDDLGMEKNCSICSEEHNVPWCFETWADFKNHVECEHPFVKVETCSVCHLMFLPHGAKRHACLQPYGAPVNKDAIFQCDRCDKAYNTRGNLVDHVRRNHKDEQHKCEICGKVYGSPMLLVFHMKRHKSVISKFRCTFCGVCLSTNYGLKEHMKRHTGEQPNACEVCGKKFTTLSALRCHKVTHGSKKPHVCHICGKAFKLRATAARHISRHLIPETNLTKRCPLCPKEMFRKIWLLKKHMEIQHPGTVEQEEICDKYKDVDDTPKDKKSIKGSLQTRGLIAASTRKKKVKETEKSDSEELEDEEEDVLEGTSDEDDDHDVKPVIDGVESVPGESAAATPSRQSARLMGKSETKKTLLVVLTRELPDKKGTEEGK